ncbi:MAG: sensor histidine kinase, partial [Bacteroidota bacterium]
RVMQAEFESERKEAEIALLKKDQEIQEGQMKQSRLIAGLVISVLAMGLLSSILLFRNKLNTQKQALTISQQARELQQQKLQDMEKEQKLKALDSHIQGQRDERKRIAKDLHDGLGTELASIKLHMIGLEQEVDATKLGELIHAIDKSCQEVRAISHHLHPPDFGESSFHEILEKLLRKFSNKHEFEADLACSSREATNALSLPQQIEIYRIIQEALHNAAKHAKPSRISLILTFFEDYLNLIIEDDGLGFDSDQMQEGLGLKNMKARAKNLQAAFVIDSSPGRGSILNFHIPLSPVSKQLA